MLGTMSSSPSISNHNSYRKTEISIQKDNFGGGGDEKNPGNSPGSAAGKEKVGFWAGAFQSLGNNLLKSTQSVVEKKWSETNLILKDSAKEGVYVVKDTSDEGIQVLKEGVSVVKDASDEGIQVLKEGVSVLKDSSKEGILVLKIGVGFVGAIATTYVASTIASHIKKAK